MGLGNGIGIGWPMASSSSSANLGYFTITGKCGGITPRERTSQLINTNRYNRGDYVDGIDDRGNTFRFRLGEIVLVPGNVLIQISGPAYTSCPIVPFTGYFGFQEYCNGTVNMRTSYYGPTTQTWRVGQVVRNINAPFADNYVIILSIVPDLGGESYPMTTLVGPALDGCPIP